MIVRKEFEVKVVATYVLWLLSKYKVNNPLQALEKIDWKIELFNPTHESFSSP